jgi:hypothetical protein
LKEIFLPIEGCGAKYRDMEPVKNIKNKQLNNFKIWRKEKYLTERGT